jgi:hypothetical protein
MIQIEPTNGPLALDAQRRLAEEAGFQIVPAPDAPKAGEAAPTFSDEARAAGAALFVRDYNLPLYPESRVGAQELAAPAAIELARNEGEPLSLGVHALQDLAGLTVSVSDVSGPDGARLSPRIWMLEPAYVCYGRRDPKAQPVQKVVLAHLRLGPVAPVDLAAGQNRQYWIVVTAPAEAVPGEYQGRIEVRSAGRPVVSRPLSVRVRRFALVEPRDFFLGAFMTLRPFLPNRETFADFKAHGLDGLLWFYSEHSWTIERDGDTIRQDFTPITQVIDAAAAAGLKGPVVVALGNDTVGFYEKRLCELFNRPLRAAGPVDGKTAQVAAIDDEVINRLYIEGLRQVLDLARRKKWPEIILLHYDEPTERLMPEATFRYRQLKAAFPDVRIYGVTMDELAWAEQLAPISDILVCNGSFAEIRDLGARTGKAVWGYSSSPAAIGAGGTRFNMGLRLWPFGLSSHWFWCYNFYPASPWNEFAGRTGAANWVTVYPGPEPGTHIPTLGWEGIREAYDDIRYCATLLRLLDNARGPLRDEIAAKYQQFLADIPKGSAQTSYGLDQDDFYAMLPSYHKLTALRAQLVGWIEQLLDAGVAET